MRRNLIDQSDRCGNRHCRNVRRDKEFLFSKTAGDAAPAHVCADHKGPLEAGGAINRSFEGWRGNVTDAWTAHEALAKRFFTHDAPYTSNQATRNGMACSAFFASEKREDADHAVQHAPLHRGLRASIKILSAKVFWHLHEKPPNVKYVVLN